jgi:hypothetical protein
VSCRRFNNIDQSSVRVGFCGLSTRVEEYTSQQLTRVYGVSARRAWTGGRNKRMGRIKIECVLARASICADIDSNVARFSVNS